MTQHTEPEKMKLDNAAFEQRVAELSGLMLNLRRSQNEAEALFLQALGGLSLPQLNVLNSIGDQAPCTMTQVADQAALSLSSITLIVDKLVAMKLVKRIRSENDRRVVYAELTEDGKKIYNAQIAHIHEVMRTILRTLDENEQAQFLNFFGRFVNALKG